MPCHMYMYVCAFVCVYVCVCVCVCTFVCGAVFVYVYVDIGEVVDHGSTCFLCDGGSWCGGNYYARQQRDALVCSKQDVRWLSHNQCV